MKIRLAIWFLLLSGICALGMGNNGVPPFFGGNGYTGPGDLVPSAIEFWGLRAYSRATAGSKAANVCNSTGGVDVQCLDFSTDSVTGKLVLQNFSAGSCASLGTNCTLKTLYSQAGLNCQASTVCDATNATVAARPFLNPTCIGGLPCVQCRGGAIQLVVVNNSNISQAQPFTVSAIAERTAAFTTAVDYINWNASTVHVGFSSSANTLYLNAGSSGTLGSVPDSAPHAIQSIANNTSSTISVDGTTSGSLTVGTNVTSVSVARLCGDGGGTELTGFIGEIGHWSGGFSAGQITAMNANQHAYWGF